MEDRRARMGLMAAQDAGDLGLAGLIRQHGPVEVWRYLRSGKGQTELARRAATIDTDALAHRTDAVGARFLIPGDDEWPPGLADLSWSEPVGRRGGEPIGLWVAGPLALNRLRPSLAMVGSRAATAYGEHVASDFGAGLAEAGCTTVSGGAYGIDACAHRGALAARGATVAVMACGLGRLYPPGNSALLEQIRRTGAVVSEYPPDQPPSRARFLVRNRLIAALAQATVVVEAGLRSGAQNTVSWTLSLQRPVLAVPGPVTSALSVTPHRLIRDAEAVLVSDVSEVLEMIRDPDPTRDDRRFQQPTLFDDLSEEQKRVQEALSARRGACVDELVVTTGLTVAAVLVCLTHLKQIGLAREPTPGMWLAGRERSRP